MEQQLDPAAQDAATARAFKKAFRERLIAWRKGQRDADDKELTQEALAEMLGISKARYQKLEIRDAFPLYLLPKLIQVTQKSYLYWVHGIDPGQSRTDRADRHKGIRAVK